MAGAFTASAPSPRPEAGTPSWSSPRTTRPWRTASPRSRPSPGRSTATSARRPGPPSLRPPPARPGALPTSASRRCPAFPRRSQPGIDVNLGARPGVDPPGERLGGAVETDDDRRELPGHDTAVRVMRDGRREARRRPENAYRRDVAEHQLAGVDAAWAGRYAYVNHPPRRLHQGQG